MSKALKDIGVCLAIIAASAVIYWDSLKLRPGTYDPLGSGTMPRMVAVIVIVLSLVAIVQAILQRHQLAPKASPFEEEHFERRPWLAVTAFGFLLVVAILMALKVPFGITATLFVFVSILAIRKGDRSVIVPGAILSLAFGWGLTYLFGTVFSVDLP